ncbi:hypothetical protein RYX36_010754, partial [Vicia faba]
LFEAKGIAGNIVHDIATTNVVIAGLIIIEAIKNLKNDVNKYRMTYCLEHPSINLLQYAKNRPKIVFCCSPKTTLLQ